MSLLFRRTKENLGTLYKDGEIIIAQGEEGCCLYVILEGQAAVWVQDDDELPVQVAFLEKDEIFGEMALLDQQPRSATVKAVGRARVLTVDKRNFVRRIHEDPTLAMRVMEKLSLRIRHLNTRLARLEGEQSCRVTAKVAPMDLVLPAVGPMPSLLTPGNLVKPVALFRLVREWNLLGWAVALQTARWFATSVSTMVNLYLNNAPMLLPTPFGLGEAEYRFLEIFLYGPYGLVVMSGMAYLLTRVAQGLPVRRRVSYAKMWEVLGFAYFGPWLPTVLVDNLLTSMGMGGPAFLVPWHLAVVGVETWVTAIGLQVVFGLEKGHSRRLALLGAAAFVFLAGLLIR